MFSNPAVFPLLSSSGSRTGRVNWLGKPERTRPAVHAFGIFAKHHLINRDVFAAGIRDLYSPIIERVAG